MSIFANKGAHLTDKQQHLAGLVWSVADLLRSDFKTSQYGSVILPFTVLRRVEFHNTSGPTLRQLASEPSVTAAGVFRYIDAFSDDVRKVMDRYDFANQVRRLEDARLLHGVVARFAELDLRPEVVSDHQMSYLYEELIRRFAELSNETAGEHFTPREVVRLIVDLLLTHEAELHKPGIVRTLLDPACGTGGILSTAEQRLREMNPEANLKVYGQELNAETYAICRSDMMIKGQDGEIVYGNSFSEDGFAGDRFDYLLSNPPFGVEWKNVADPVKKEHERDGFAGRFGAGLPRINDGSFLFLQHMISKMKRPGQGGARLAIIFNGSPLFTGAAGSGESEIRRWIIESDWLEAVVALPDQLFYNTGISTYCWIVSNRKSEERRGKVQLIDARAHFTKMRKSLGEKRKEISAEQITEIVRLHGEFAESEKVKIFSNESFGFLRITVERPLRLRWEVSEETLAKFDTDKTIAKLSEEVRAALRTGLDRWGDKVITDARLIRKRVVELLSGAGQRGKALQDVVLTALSVRDPDAPPVLDDKGNIEPDPELRDYKNVPLPPASVTFEADVKDRLSTVECKSAVDRHIEAEVRPYVPDAWVDHTKTKIGYEVPLTLFFRPPLNTKFVPLSQFAQLETVRIAIADRRSRPRHLRAQDLRTVNSAVELPEASESSQTVTPCMDGDVVGRAGNWRLLPPGFGQAVTTLSVLRPLGNYARALCEWLNSSNDHERFQAGRDLMNVPVPADLIQDEQIDNLLEDVQEGRRALRDTTANLLPNVFNDATPDIRKLREDIGAAATQARLIGELVQPILDPIWRAELDYPFHVAALARRYRISTQPAERKDALLKLGEGTARLVGVLTLSEFIENGEFPEKLQKQFRIGATFGTWVTLIRKFMDEIEEPRMRELSDVKHHGELHSLLAAVKDFRNDSGHAHGVRASHEIVEEADQLEPRVVSALVTANWLSGLHLDWVERCEYLDESSYRLIGQRLRGSHPSWEPFERPSTYPLKPDHVYAGNTRSGQPVDLWPLAAVFLCPKCNAQEFFLINEVQGGVVTLRSLEEHSMEISLPTAI